MKKPTTQSVVDKTIATRGVVYGDPKKSHDRIGMAWSGLLQQHYDITLPHPIPAHIVAMMMVMFKVQRSARKFKADNFLDGKAYLQFSEEFQKQYEKQKRTK